MIHLSRYRVYTNMLPTTAIVLIHRIDKGTNPIDQRVYIYSIWIHLHVTLGWQFEQKFIIIIFIKCNLKHHALYAIQYFKTVVNLALNGIKSQMRDEIQW